MGCSVILQADITPGARSMMHTLLLKNFPYAKNAAGDQEWEFTREDLTALKLLRLAERDEHPKTPHWTLGRIIEQVERDGWGGVIVNL